MKEYTSGPLSGLLKPKYRVVSTILGENYIPDKGLDIYIDLNTFVSAMASSQKYLASLPFSSNTEKDMILSTLMIVKHWKDYSRKWEDVRIFLIVNDFEMGDLPERKQLNAYLAPYINKFSNDRYQQLKYYWSEALNIIDPLLQYIPNVHLIRCNRLDSFIIPEIIHDYKTNPRDRLIVSGSPMMTGYAFTNNTKVAYTCYRRTGMTQMDDPLMIVQTLTRIDDDVMTAFTTNKVFYNLLNTIIGDKDRGIIGVTQFGISTFANDLIRAIERRDVPKEPKSIESVLPVIHESYHAYLKKNYPLMDIDLHAQMIPPSLIEKMKSLIINKIDIDALMKFSIDGLNLMELL